MRAHVIRVFRERDSADACATGSPGLNLDDNCAAEFLRDGDRFIDGRCCAATRDLESIRGEDRFALIFVKSSHVWVVFRMKTPNVQRSTSNIQHPTRKR